MRKAGDARTDPIVTSLSSDAGPAPTAGPAAPASAAAKVYFDKQVNQLTLAEGAVLAALIRTP
uniref:transglycosylase domain-containing protein n=1 Tax=Nocardia abscessus TaxID=120957 RepID=UPI002453F2FE